MIIRLNRTMENVLKHIFQGYFLPKDKQSMISMTGYNVENPLGRGGGEIFMTKSEAKRS